MKADVRTGNIFRTVLLRMRNFQIEVVQKTKMSILCSMIFFFPRIVSFMK